MGVLGKVLGALTGGGKKKSTSESESETEQTLKGTSTTAQTGTSKAVEAATSVAEGATTRATDQATKEESSQTGVRAGESATTGTTRTFSEDILGQLERLFAGAGGAVGGTDTADLKAGLSSFDSDKFVSGLVGKAESDLTARRTEGLNTLASSIGGRENSSFQLLADRASREDATALAGIESNAIASAAGIEANNLSALTGASGGDANLLGVIGNLLKGGESTTEQAGTTAETTEATGATTGRAVGSDAGTSTQATESQATKDLVEIINSLVTQDQTQTGKTKSSGSGTQTTGGSLGGLLGNIAAFQELGD